jgi:DNA-binding NtrC family response regulator
MDPTIDDALRALPVLYVDDEPENLALFELQFGREFNVATASSGAQALERFGAAEVSVLLTDERMPGMTGIDLLSRVVERWPDTIRMIVSAYSDAQRLLQAMNRGHAHEYILKPWTKEELSACLQRGLTMASRRKALAARAELSEAYERDARQSVASSVLAGGLDRVISRARRAGTSDATVLISGETGTGKEVIARFIHDASPRAHGPFIRVNCGALAESLLESELFGHEAGAFTGAQRLRRGRFELAHGGSILLDEVGDISPKMQISLLRVLQEREVERVGGTTAIKLNARVLAATHRDLSALVASGVFREDLYYRLNVIPIELPPLRARIQDLEPLLHHLLAKHSRGRPLALEEDVLARLKEYSWPGNVRELENLIQRAIALCNGSTLSVEDFCLTLPSRPVEKAVRDEAREVEAEQLRSLLVAQGGNLARAARILGIPRTTLLGRARRCGLVP